MGQMGLLRIIISLPVILRERLIQSLLMEVAGLKHLLVVFPYKLIKDLFQMQGLSFNFQDSVQHTQAPALSAGQWIG